MSFISRWSCKFRSLLLSRCISRSRTFSPQHALNTDGLFLAWLGSLEIVKELGNRGVWEE